MVVDITRVIPKPRLPWRSKVWRRVRNWYRLKKQKRGPVPSMELPGLPFRLNELKPFYLLAKERGSSPGIMTPWRQIWNRGITELVPMMRESIVRFYLLYVNTCVLIYKIVSLIMKPLEKMWHRGLQEISITSRELNRYAERVPDWLYKRRVPAPHKEKVIVTQIGFDGKVSEELDADGLPLFDIAPGMIRKPSFSVLTDWANGAIYQKKDKDEHFPGEVVRHRYKQFKKNVPFIENALAADEIEGKGPLYLVGNGPSVEELAPLFNRITKGTIVALNGAYRKIPKVDYFWCGDWLGKKEWLKDVDVTGKKAIFVIYAPNFLVDREWDQIYFYGHNTAEDHMHRMRATTRKKFGKDWPLYCQAVTTTATAYHWAVCQGFDPIIFVGVDGKLTSNLQLHTEDNSEIVKKDCIGYGIEHLAYCLFVDVGTIFANRLGIRVVNASTFEKKDKPGFMDYEKSSILGHNSIVRDRHLMKHVPLAAVIDQMEEEFKEVL